MIDISTENLVALRKVPASLPHRPHLSTIIRWHRRGVSGHRLEVLKIGGRVFTSSEAVGRFISAISGALTAEHVDPSIGSSAASDPSNERLKGCGW